MGGFYIMQSDAIRLLTVAIAVSVPQDEVAFSMLQRDYILGFEQYYKERTKERRMAGMKDDPVYLDEMINYAVKELPIRVPNCRSLTGLYSEAKKMEIKRRFISENVSQMLTRLAKRETIKSNIRQTLHAQDRQKNHAAIDSTKFDSIFTDFMVMFEESCAASFRFEGEFTAYVVYSWKNYYYASHNRDIWRILRDVDFAKRETEMPSTEIHHIEEVQLHDLHIHELIINIVAINDLLFSHSGQTDDARGVCYDIFYLILNYLCSNKVKELNSKMEGIQLSLVDELDRRENRNGLSENKSIASKISNAKELVTFLFDCIRRGEWSLDNIIELRDKCFMLGKKDRDGKNCVWKDVYKKAETSRYLDMKTTPHNYIAFDKLIKGVLSVYSLMMALEERGASLVASYPTLARVFNDKALSRNIATLQDLEYIDMMEQLQKAPLEDCQHGDLLTFPEMVHEYAGSDDNNQSHIVGYRNNAKLLGLLDNPILKQRGNLQTPFQRLKSVAAAITAIPCSYEAYVFSLYACKNVPSRIAPLATLSPYDVVKGSFSNIYYNKYLANDPSKSAYYLYKVASKEQSMLTFEWHIGNGLLPCVTFERIVGFEGERPIVDSTYCLYVPLVDKFLLCPFTDVDEQVTKLPTDDIHNLRQITMSYIFDGRQMALLSSGYRAVPLPVLNLLLRESDDAGKVQSMSSEVAVANSLGFDSIVGIDNLLAPNILRAFKNIEVYSEYQAPVDRYMKWMGEISLLQNSVVDILQLMYSYGLYLALNGSDGTSIEEINRGRELVYSLLKSEFKEENLVWFFSVLENYRAKKTLQKIDFQWSNVSATQIEFTSIDLSCLNVVYGNDLPDCERDSLMYDLIKSLSSYDTPAKRFVQLYNFLNVRLNFLRLLRDAYDISFNFISTDLSTLGCELDSQFKIEETLNSTKMGLNAGGLMDIKYALLDTIPIEDMTRFISDIRLSNGTYFSVLCDKLFEYFDKCRQDIASLVDYEVSKGQNIQSEFIEFGSLFYAIGPYPNKFVLDLLGDIRPKAKTDDAGFIIMKNSYLRGHSGNSEFYIHITGRMLESYRGTLKPKTFNFSLKEDCTLYEEIVRDAQNSVW